ncbi:MAG: hypothetical protein N3A02_08725 [Rectinema sp.]|nr:hypothetical protein [Rectinema sp.]
MNTDPRAPDEKRSAKNHSHQSRRHRSSKNASSPSKAEKKAAPVQPENRKKPEPPPLCEVCGKPVFDLVGAIASRESGAPIHFDCAIELLSKQEHLAADEKIIYIGSGCFAVCVQMPNGKLEMRRKIRWEVSGTVAPWRKSMLSSPNLP